MGQQSPSSQATETPWPALLRDREAAAFLSISRASLWQRSSSGDLPAPVTVAGRCVRWRRADLERFVLALRPRERKAVA
ncbi:MAG TPA: helix-turn-helix domain-containing protein [Tepidisphaeraceae bacterium]|nr:helix-turn-helix domain-containing protein [Tepidisphaeraceae bacterium]